MSPEGLCVALGCHRLQTGGGLLLIGSLSPLLKLLGLTLNMQLDRRSGRGGVQSVLVPALLGLFCHTKSLGGPSSCRRQLSRRRMETQ